MLKVNNLTRSFHSLKAVDDISFEVKRGEVLGFIGANGAGKSTTMRLLTGYLTPDTGQIYINDKLLIENEVECKSLIGYLPERSPMYGDMLVKDFLSFCGSLRKIKNLQKRIKEVIQMCFLEEVVFRRIDTLSKGFRQRVCFAQSIIHEPDLLILDEPTDGLDPRQKNEMRKIIKNYGENKAIILSTHILEEIDFLASKILLIHKGKIIVNEDINAFKKRDESLTNTFLNLTNI